MNLLSLIGIMLIVAVLWGVGMCNSHKIVKKMFPNLDYVLTVGVGLTSYLILTGLVLVIIGQLL